MFKKALSMAFLFVAMVGLAREGRATAIPGAKSSHGPGVAAYNNLIYVTYIRKSDSRLVYQTTTTGTNWSGEVLIPLGTTPKSKVSAATYNNRMYIFYPKSSGTSLHYRYLDSSGSWSGEGQIVGASTDDGPGLAVFNNLLYIFWETAGSSSDRIRYATLDINNIQSGVSIVPFGLTFRGPGAAVFNNRIYLSYSGTNGGVENGHNIYYGYMDINGIWYGDWRPTGDPRTTTGPALAPLGTELWWMYEAKEVTNAHCYSKRLNTLGQWTAEVDIWPAGSDTRVNATTYNNKIWLVGGINFFNDPNSVQFFLLP